MSSRFFCDTNCELWWEKAEALGLNVIGMPYCIDDEERDYDLGKNTDFKDFYDRVRSGSMPITSALNEQNYIDYFEPVFENGEDIIYVHFSHNLSGTFNQMYKAVEQLKEKYPDRKFYEADTLAISAGGEQIVWAAANMWKRGDSEESIVKWVEDNRQKFATYFVVDDLNHLKRGGRVSATSAIVGGMLNIKPILKINAEGKIVKHGTAKGFKKGLATIVDIMKELGENIADNPIIIAHADNVDGANYLKNLIIEYAGSGNNLWIQPVGPTVGTHCGPGTVAISFSAKRRDL